MDDFLLESATLTAGFPDRDLVAMAAALAVVEGSATLRLQRLHRDRPVRTVRVAGDTTLADLAHCLVAQVHEFWRALNRR